VQFEVTRASLEAHDIASEGFILKN